MDFIESVEAFQLLQNEKPHLVGGMGKSFTDELVVETSLAGGMAFEPQDG